MTDPLRVRLMALVAELREEGVRDIRHVLWADRIATALAASESDKGTDAQSRRLFNLVAAWRKRAEREHARGNALDRARDAQNYAYGQEHMLDLCANELAAALAAPEGDSAQGTWRVGRKVGRTIYQQQGAASTNDDPLIGVMDTRELAQAVVDAHNAVLRAAPAAEDEAAKAHSYLSRLLLYAAPQCEPLPDLLGLCTQIDNVLTGLVEYHRAAAPQEPRCLTCGHLHFYETDEGGFDSSDTVPWGKCKTCACKTPNYNKNYEASAAPQEPTPTDPLDPCEGHPIYPTVKPR